MVTILQVDFPLDGPFGEAMAQEFKDLAVSINDEPGFLWKIWTENEAEKEAGGIYAFDSNEHAQQYLTMHRARLKSLGVIQVNAKLFKINNGLTTITNGRID
ncbi:monooxygenase [Staphylococcus edaphicus]|uniref:Monooxygenase n=1 Tax=Staphylococcus edaphicus TaxID=1955013 RepID=A0A2C6WMW6_9STAP|nr:monooxygenase [Staphylococcus edaphicus]PHK49425.1 monooxygenase [Staphylococcus edaphicus]UQW81248.1 monooxygenase [Staphylococcus edaphicus]